MWFLCFYQTWPISSLSRSQRSFLRYNTDHGASLLSALPSLCIWLRVNVNVFTIAGGPLRPSTLISCLAHSAFSTTHYWDTKRSCLRASAYLVPFFRRLFSSVATSSSPINILFKHHCLKRTLCDHYYVKFLPLSQPLLVLTFPLATLLFFIVHISYDILSMLLIWLISHLLPKLPPFELREDIHLVLLVCSAFLSQVLEQYLTYNHERMDLGLFLKDFTFKLRSTKMYWKPAM